MEAVKDVTDWKNVGLQLGLRYSTLLEISITQRDSIADCKLEMLVAWLQQRDNVPQKERPSWLMLQVALRRMGKNELADRIEVSSSLL